MRHGLLPTLALIAVGFLPGILLGGGAGYWKVRAERATTAATIERFKTIAMTRAAQADEARKELRVMTLRARRAEDRAVVAADSSALWRQRYAALPRPAPFDTAAWMSNLPLFTATADSALDACGSAVAICHEALTAKDVALEQADSTIGFLELARDAERDRATFAEAEWERTMDALERRVRTEKLKVGGSFLAGVGLCVGTVALAR